ncbi:hypothetical protein [Porphyrobacter sp. YT40]|uniref:hypothetical protein n=1 Tax=Porphyrobacter sp. YT40 TaxID=2547601 RepID=UPI00114461CB|nr:hypothetical protein [Porphyrobacter sp. YT40]QDH33380.1 hypothetical protein E2E27_02930 [Porphyrobacter sp. YT40]
MTHTQQALLMGGVLTAIALLAVFDVIPQEVAQYAPLAVVPFVLAQRGSGCSLRQQGRGA